MIKCFLCLAMLLLSCKKDDSSNVCGCTAPPIGEIADKIGRLGQTRSGDWSISNFPGIEGDVYLICNAEFPSLLPLINDVKKATTYKIDTIQFSGKLRAVCPSQMGSGGTGGNPYLVELTKITKIK